ncbi:hypothetical protein [Mycobacterium sp. 236(2023)]|uniref:hypothetical protein n=1 Tax=Mycobacterium sp. 236(2023) TaxID=3038163 RepID=UPI002414F713|nr:hypothetical protein [Mycobacterium sp. 236(2023)]MDG4668632.1 hypothetical protein [Mycobacterium sp. 236(2023)]
MERPPRPQTFSELIAAVSDEFGIFLEIVNTGGGSEVMHGRLESGHWLVVTDAEDFLADIDDQLSSDAEGYPLGWFVGVYENDGSDGFDRPASYAEGGCVTYVQRDEARFR